MGQIADLAARTVYVTFASYRKWILPIPFLIGEAVSAFQRRKREALHAQVSASQATSAVEGISWQQFEQLAGESFRRRGFAVVETGGGGGGADGGVDLVLKKGGERYLVQCKHWRAMQVGVPVVRELYGVMAARGATGGFVVTSGKFSAEAVAFAQGRNIELIDGKALGIMIRGAKVPPSAPHEALASGPKAVLKVARGRTRVPPDAAPRW